MARKKSQHTASGETSARPGLYYSPGDDKWGGFLNLRVTEEEKARFYAYAESEPNWYWSVLVELLGEGVKLSVTYDRDNQAFIATLTGRLVAGLAERYCATARAGTFEESVALIVYKHHVLAGGDWANYLPKSQTLLAWG